MNKRLQEKNEADILWWNAFTSEFFEDDASMTLNFCLDEGPKTFTIGRNLIPRYFLSIFDGGASDLSYTLVQPKESYQNNTVVLDCEKTTMTTTYLKPLPTKVLTEGRLLVEFTFDDLMRIRNWHFVVHHHQELVSRNVLMTDPGVMDELSKNITCKGMTSNTLNYLRLCFILEPMQELMSRHKAFNMTPRDCLKSTLFQRWRLYGSPGAVEANHQPEIPWPVGQNNNTNFTKRRPSTTKRESNSTGKPKRRTQKRKPSTPTTSAASSAAVSTNSSVNKKKTLSPSRAVSNFGLTSQDVMVVGEPSLMGGELCDEDERLITRLTSLENTGYDTAGTQEDEFRNSPLTNSSPAMPPWSGDGRKPPPEDGVNE